MFFFRWQVIGLELWVQISTADEGKCQAVDVMLSTVGLVLGGGCKCWTHTARPSHYLCPAGCSGERCSADCIGRKLIWALRWDYPRADLSGSN